MAEARGAVRVRFLEVGVFLSVLAVSSKKLLDIMKKVLLKYKCVYSLPSDRSFGRIG
jgi:hypothetical protein